MSRYTQSTYHTAYPQPNNPMFPRKQPGAAHRVWWRVAGWLGVVLLIGAGYVAFFTNVFRITYTIVDGNRYIHTDAIQQLTDKYLAQKYVWFIPKNTYFGASSHALERYLRKELGKERALANLTVRTAVTGAVYIHLEERTPNLVYSINGVTYLMDRDGVITEAVQPGRKIDPTFPLLYDQTSRSVAIADHALSPTLAEFIFTSYATLSQTTDIPVDFFYLPPITCAEILPTGQTTNINTSSVNTNAVQQNVNTVPHLNLNVNHATNTNTSTNGNTNATEQGSDTTLTPATCDLAAQVRSVRDVRLHTIEKWELYFRSDDTLAAQLSRFTRLVAGKNLDRKKLSYVDLRFGDNVVYK